MEVSFVNEAPGAQTSIRKIGLSLNLEIDLWSLHFSSGIQWNVTPKKFWNIPDFEQVFKKIYDKKINLPQSCIWDGWMDGWE
jgi:hypothetical protein